VVGAVRDVSSKDAESLKTLPVGQSSRLVLVQIDSGNDEDPTKAVEALASQHSVDYLDMVIANAGISRYFGKALVTPSPEAIEHYRINALGPLLLFQSIQPLLSRAFNPKFVTISSGAGSLAGIETLKVENTAYGASKAALNFITRRIHAENPWLIAFPINPGWLQTDVRC
jgi:norsolorinic acid ketoreductase